MGRVVVVGSLNIDLVTHVERHPKPGETVRGTGLERLAGGKGANQAVAASAAGAAVVMVGCVGSDEAGSAYVARLSALGIDVASIRVAPDCPTGHALITIDDAGENSIVVVAGANAAMVVDDLEVLESVGPGDVVLLQLEVPPEVVIAASRRASAKGARVVLNLAPYAAVPPDVVALADPLVVNEHEALWLADSEAMPASLVVTFGAAGAAWDGDQLTGPVVDQPDVLDTTGAGDAFCGALGAALVAGADRHEALQTALAAGADAVRYLGAQRDPAL
ncbi:MAG TPA: ribokinase [Dermatophilaceae bacterium]|jgi:ribokinase|nr:ribokinase [Dermatophilaceae bacterium]